MIRNNIVPRPNWEEKVSEVGLIWHSVDGDPYWNESGYYQFTSAQITEIENASMAVYQLLLEAGDYVIKSKQLNLFGIPAYCHDAIERAWNEEPPALNYGRFDFGYDGVSPPKLFEFNCDTPTSLLEASVIQWYWKEEVFPQYDQYNSIHESLVARWVELEPRLRGSLIHFAHIDDAAGEDTITTTYMRDIAEEAGLKTQGVLMQDIGWNGTQFVDAFDTPIKVIQKLYPWEWLVNEDFGKHIISTLDQTLWIEPIWKMLWSNKAILAALHYIAPEHPNLLKTYLDKDERISELSSYVRKPILAREGANIEIHDGSILHTSVDQEYGEEGYIHQELYKLPEFDGRYPVIGAWLVDGAPIGMGIREDGLITGNTAKFIPHIIKD